MPATGAAIAPSAPRSEIIGNVRTPPKSRVRSLES